MSMDKVYITVNVPDGVDPYELMSAIRQMIWSAGNLCKELGGRDIEIAHCANYPQFAESAARAMAEQ